MNHSWVHLIVFHPVQHNPKPCTVLRKASLTRAVSHPRPDIHVNASGIGYILGLMLQLVELISQQMIGDDIHLVSKPSNLYVSEASRLLSSLGHAPCALAARAALAAALALSRASSLRLAAMGARRAAIVSEAARASAGLLTKAGMLPVVPFKRAGREGRGGDQPRRNSSGPARLCDDVGARRCAALRRGGRVHGM